MSATSLFSKLIVIAMTIIVPLMSMPTKQSSNTYQQSMQIGRANTAQILWHPSGHLLTIRSNQDIWLYTDNFVDVAHLLPASPIDSYSVLGSMAWSPDGTRLAATLLTQTPTVAYRSVQIWTLATLQISLNISSTQIAGGSIIWSPDNTKIALLGDKEVQIWSASTGQVINRLIGHTDQIEAIAWSRDGSKIVSASLDNTIRIWNVSSGQALFVFSRFTPFVSWSPDGQGIAIAVQNDIQILNATSGQTQTTLAGHTNAINFMTWGKTKIISTGLDHTARVWNVPTSQLINTFSGFTTTVEQSDLSPDETNLATVGRDNVARIWNVSTGQLVRALQAGTQSVYSISWNPTGNKIASASLGNIIQIWDPVTGQLLNTLQGHTDAVLTVAWSPDGTKLASGDQVPNASTVRIWNAGNSQQLWNLQGHTNGVKSVTWSPDSSKVASGDGSGNIKIWNISTGQSLAAFQGDTVSVNALSWSPDGSKLASAGEDDLIRIWDTATWSLTTTIGSTEAVSTSLTWIDNTRIANGAFDSKIRIWNIVSGDLLQTLEGHHLFVTSVMWSPTNQKLLSGSADGTIRVWDLSGQNLAVIQGYTVSINSVAWSPDGSKIASGDAAFIRIFAASSTGTPTPTPPSSLKLQYYSDPGVSGNIVDGIMPDFNIVNTGNTTVPLSELKIRYYFTKDTTNPSVTFRYVCSYTDLPNGCGGSTLVRGTVTDLGTLIAGVDAYLELSFTGGTLAANSQTNEILSYVNKSDWSNYTQNNDYSFDGTRGEVFSDWNKVTLYRNGVLIWGIEPH